MMGMTMTLRGGFDVNIGRGSSYGASTEHQIFAYESMDRTRAWRITYGSVWIQELLHGTGGGDSRAMVQWTLSTDTLGPVTISSGATAREWQRRMGAGDNRTIGWTIQDWQTRDNTNADFLTPGFGGSGGQGFQLLLDEDRIATNELWLQAFGVTEGGADLELQCNYYIEMEQIKITPSESILQQVKGIGQSVDS